MTLASELAESRKTSETGPLLEATNITTRFETPHGMLTAVDDVSVTIRKGEALGVVGESGSGKSVLTRSLMGLLPKAGVHHSGKVVFDGQDISELSKKGRSAMWGPEMAMIFQDPMTSLSPVMKIGHQLTDGILHHMGVKKAEARRMALALLDEVGIPEAERRLDEYPHQLSGGMRQRIVIAIGLSCGPRMLFADEPTTALDVTVQAQILDLLQREQRNRNMSMVLVTHDLGIVAGRTDEIAVMYGGRIVEQAPTRTLFREMRMPYTEALIQSIPKLENPVHTRLAVIPGRPPNPVHQPKGCRFAPRCRYAQARCLEEEPTLQDATSDGHKYACFYPVGTEANAEAERKNKEAGRLDETGVIIDTTVNADT